MIVPRRCSRSLLPHARFRACLAAPCRHLRSPGVCRLPSSFGGPSLQITGSGGTTGLGWLALLFVTGGFLVWAVARVLWPALPLWSFILAGALIAASEPLWEFASRVGGIAWNIVCNMALCTAVSLVVWAVGCILWPGLSVWPFVVVGVLAIPALLLLAGLVLGLGWMLSPGSADRHRLGEAE